MAFNRFPSIVIKDDNFEEDVKPLIKQIRPQWNLNNLKIKRFHGGVSNLLFGVHSDEEFTKDTDMILVRLYGEMLLDRDIEMENMAALSKFDLSAQVWGRFGNGCAYQYFHGAPLSILDARDDTCITLIIKELVKLHKVQLNLDRPKEPFIFPKMREMAGCLPANLSDPEKNKKYLLCFPNKSTIFEEIECLEKHLVRPDYPVTFCHNDTLVYNMIINDKKDRIHLIDFEYADYNYCAFDIGNHFNEFAGLENIDYSLYPDEVFQKYWIRKYLETRTSAPEINGHTYNGDAIIVKDDEVNFWYKMVNKFALMSNLFWSIWSIWQDQNSSINFDYLDYAIQRYNQYKNKKQEFLEL